MVDLPLLISILSLIGVTTIGILNWRSGRFKPQVDVSNALKTMQDVTNQAIDGQAKLTAEVTDLKRHLKGQYEIRIVARFYPKPEIIEVSMRLLPLARRKASAQADGGS